MEVINESDQEVTWWCYNSDDTVQWVAMKEGDLRANGGRTSYDPPSNATGAYYVKITVKAVGELTSRGPPPAALWGVPTHVGTEPYACKGPADTKSRAARNVTEGRSRSSTNRTWM
jgi:hypothetical protein